MHNVGALIIRIGSLGSYYTITISNKAYPPNKQTKTKNEKHRVYIYIYIYLYLYIYIYI